MIRSNLQRINQNQINMNDLNRAIASGKKLIHASDDPGGFSRIARFKTTVRQSEQYLRNINDANGWVETTVSVMDQLVSIISDAKDAATKGADANMTATSRAALAKTIDAKLQEAITLANSRHAGKNIFAGTETKENTIFSINGDLITYNGNSEEISRKISENLYVTINITGQQLIDTGVFQSLIDLRTALNNDDQTAIRDLIDEFTTVNENVLSLSTTEGSVLNNLTLAENRIESSIIDLNTFISKDEDVDMAEAIIKYESEQLAYQAALQTTSKIMSLNIMDYLV